MTTLSEDIDYLAVETQSESNDGRASAATWEHEDLAQARRNYDRYILKNITVLNVLFIFIKKLMSMMLSLKNWRAICCYVGAINIFDTVYDSFIQS